MINFTRIILLLALKSYFLILAPPAQSHFVKSDSGIGAVLHVDPGDDPIAGEPSKIIFEFKDIENRFDLSNCDCKIVVTGEGKEILSQSLKPVALDQKLSSVTPIIFPEKNIYKLKVTGKSYQTDFTDFELNYDVRVAKDSQESIISQDKPWWSEHIIYLTSGFLVLAFLVFALIKQSMNKK